MRKTTEHADMSLEDDATSFTLRDFLTIIFKRRRLVLVFFLVVVLTVTVRTALLAPIYESAALILVKKDAELPLEPSESKQLIINTVSEADVASEVAILRSRQLLEEVANSLGETALPEKGLLQKTRRLLKAMLEKTEEHSVRDVMVLHLQKELKVGPAPKSNTIRISYRSEDPELAKSVVETVTEHYLDRRNEVYQPVRTATFFEEQTQLLQERLVQAENALRDYIVTAGLTMVKTRESGALAVHKQDVLQRLGRLESLLSDAEDAVREYEQKTEILEDALAQEPERLSSTIKDPGTAELETGLVALQLKRDALIQEFSPENRQVQDVDAQIKLASERLRQLDARAGNVSGTTLNSVHQSLKESLFQARAELEGQRARHTTIQGQIAAHKRELADLNQKGFKLESLRREFVAAEEAFVLFKRKQEEVRTSTAMDQYKIVNVSILQPAERPLEKVAPRSTLHVAFALVLGSVGGLSLAFVMERFSHSFTTGQDLERKLGVVHLASVPDDRESRAKSHV